MVNRLPVSRAAYLRPRLLGMGDDAATATSSDSSTQSLINSITNLLTPVATAVVTATLTPAGSAPAAAKPATTVPVSSTVSTTSKYLLYGGIALLGVVVFLKLRKRKK